MGRSLQFSPPHLFLLLCFNCVVFFFTKWPVWPLVFKLSIQHRHRNIHYVSKFTVISANIRSLLICIVVPIHSNLWWIIVLCTHFIDKTFKIVSLGPFKDVPIYIFWIRIQSGQHGYSLDTFGDFLRRCCLLHRLSAWDFALFRSKFHVCSAVARLACFFQPTPQVTLCNTVRIHRLSSGI